MLLARILSLVAFLCTIKTSPCHAELSLARSGMPEAVIVAPHPVSAMPSGAAGIGTLSLSSARSGTLLHERFDGQSGISIAPRGWQATEGTFVIGSGGVISAKRGRENQFSATADKPLPTPHRVTEADALTLRFVLHLPSAHKEEAWTYVRLHTADGKRWTHGFAIGHGGTMAFSMAAEPNDPDPVPIPNDAGPVIDLQMVLGAKRAAWSWRPHGTSETWRTITSWSVAEPPTITGVRLASSNHIDNSAGDREAKRLVSATQDLALALEQITGSRFLAVTEDQVPKGMSRIFIGDTPTIRALCPDVDFDRLGTDEILVRTVDNDLVLSGGRPRGVIYAIHTFLQDVVGCRWWAAGAEHFPADPDLAIGALDTQYRPPFEFRYITGGHSSTFEARSRHRLSFDLRFDTGTHSIPKQLPKTLFLEHPDWFMYCPDDTWPNKKYNYQATLRSFQRTIDTETDRNDLHLIRQYMEIAKKTRRIPQQPCLNNEGARRTITRAALAELEARPEAWRSRPAVLWVTQNDGRYMCRCDACAAVQKKEGSDSANWLSLVNEIAAEVEKQQPNVLVGAFAYLHTEAPPRTVRPRKNVLIYIALLQSNKRDSVRYYEGHARGLEKWAEIADHVWVWDYDTSFRNYFQPHPNYYVNGESLKWFREIGIDGVMIQSNRGIAADLAPMRAWVTGQMMWNPDRDPRALMIEFANGYYGAAGPWIMLYVDLLHAAVHRKSDYWLGCYRDSTTGWLELEDIHVAIDLLDQAARAVKDDPARSQRIWMARRAIDFAWLDRYDELKKTAEEKGISLRLPDPVSVVDSLAPYRDTWGNFREGPRPADFYAYFDRLRELFPSSQSQSH